MFGEVLIKKVEMMMNLNDCLYWAIEKSLNIDEFKELWRKPSKFKRRLGLEREDKVGLDKIPLIENDLKININMTGDHTYTSSHSHTKICNVKLENGHYSYVNKPKAITKRLVYKKQNLIMTYVEKDKVIVYDGDELDEWTLSQYYKVKNNRYDDDVIMLTSSTKIIIKEYDNFISEERKIRLASNGKIKYFESGVRYKEVAFKLFDMMSMGVDEPDQINEIEEQWIQDAM